MIPLMQKLIRAIAEVDIPRIKLYALAVVPQISACRPSSAKMLMNKLFYGIYTAGEMGNVVDRLQDAYDCLGFSCQDIGAYKNIPECANPPEGLPLAGFPVTKSVRGSSKIDLDVLQIKILTKLSGWGPASDIYSFGKNAVKSQEDHQYHVLKEMANDQNRDEVIPFFADFVRSWVLQIMPITLYRGL